MNYAYVTVLSTNNYYKGVLVLFESLKNTNPQIKNFVVLVNEKIDRRIINDLDNRGYKVIIKNSISSPNVYNKKYTHWSNTFDKFNIFGLTEYDKIVYLDSDMYINRNIDELFLLPHMSASIAGQDMNKDWDNLNSGMMVIVPNQDIVTGLIDLLKSRDYENIGDQDLIGEYFDWHNQNLKISENYNLFAGYIDYYINKLNYNLDNLSIIHFVGTKKPWMEDEEGRKRLLEEKNKQGKKYEALFLNKYFDLLNKIEK